MKTSILTCLTALFLSSSCAIFVDEFQVNQKEIIDFLLSDLPIPEDSKIKKSYFLYRTSSCIWMGAYVFKGWARDNINIF